MELNFPFASNRSRFNWRWLLVSVVLLSRPAWAQLDTYSDPYTGPAINLPAATNFVMNGTFSITTPGVLSSWEASLYYGWSSTKNFTNNSEMDCVTGFRFNTKLSTGLLNYPAASFYNSGTINNYVDYGAALGGVEIWASNIYNPGTIFIGQDGIGKISGNNLDLSGGAITINSPFLSTSNLAGFYGQTAGVGLNTNAWDPSFNLTPTSAYSSGPNPYYLILPNATAYLAFFTNNASSNIIVRAVFLNNLSSNTTPANVYFGNIGVGNGAGNVEWTAPYVNPVDGSTATNYLYLNNNYTQGAATNLQINASGIPNNFTFFSSPVSLSAGLLQVTNTGFPAGFTYPAGGITNRYSYVNASLVSSTIDTNESNPQDYRYWTNWAGRLEITASNVLTLSQSTIQGMNYLRLTSTNQYNNDGSSTIVAAYADAYLGATNGSLTISNLFASEVSGWSGNVQAWSTDWTTAPNAAGFTYEYKVMLVQSSLNPYSTPQQQDVVLYSSNNVVISDQLNLQRKLSLNCTNLLLTTNGFSSGAASFQGELNLFNSSMNWAASTPRLQVLTNNGAIRVWTTLATTFGTATVPYLEFVNSGIISNAGGSYVFANDVQSGGNFNAGTGLFSVQAQTAALTNGIITTPQTFASTSSSLIIGGNTITVGRSLTLTATNLLTDTGVTNGNIWTIGASNSGSSSYNGLVLPLLPAAGDLLGTTVTNIAVSGTKVTDIWSGHDYGATPAGYSNNAALGQLILDVKAYNNSKNGFIFKGTATDGSTNALYVDRLTLLDFANYTNRLNFTNLALIFSNNLVIYYAQAINADGQDISEKLNTFNNNHLRWVPSYAGYFSSTNLVYPLGVTNTVNTALANSGVIDSDGDGNFNNADATPFFVPALVNFTEALTNLPPRSIRLQWETIPNGTNYIYYTTNLAAPVWLPLTNFNNYYYGPNLAKTNASHVNWFASPQSYPGPTTNVWIFDALTNTPHFYRVMVQPWLTYPN
jgi:hypothetical protein